MHRDIKLEKILFKNKTSSVPVIGGFSLACDLMNSDKLKTVCGTPGYIAPEVFKKEWNL